MKMKKNIPIIMISLLLFLGVGILSYPIISNLICKYTSSVSIRNYNQYVAAADTKELDQQCALAKQYNAILNGTGDGSVSLDQYNSLLAINEDHTIGYIEIPKIGVYLPIYHGTGKEVLEKGVGHLEGTSLPVGGMSTHCVLSGHTGLPVAELFTDLDQMQTGDLFYIHVLNHILAYEVDQILVVLPEETDAIQIEEGKDYVTLLTCTPYGVNDHRLLVRGTRVDYQDPVPVQQKVDTTTRAALTKEKVLWYAGTAACLAGLAVGSCKRRKKRNKEMEGK